MRDKLAVVRDLERHAVPSGDLAQLVARAFDALIQLRSVQKLAIVRKPRAKPRRTKQGSRHVPAAVRRQVWRRDGGRCAFIGVGGHRCTERGGLEYHHVQPYAAGGEATVENIQLRCRAHNGYEASLFFAAPGGRTGAVKEAAGKYAVSWESRPFRNGTDSGGNKEGWV